MQASTRYIPFLQATAICSFLGAITTAILLFMPNPEAADFEAQAALSGNSLYLFRRWVLFLHPQVNILASIGIAWLLLKKYPLQIIFGTLFLFVWAYTEMAQQALLIDSLNQLWRPAYIEADSELLQNRYHTLIETANGISDSKYFLLLYGFGLGSLFYGLAFIREQGLGKALGISLLFIGILSLASFARYYVGASGLNEMVNWSYRWIYTYLQPLVRIGIGIWILLEIKKLS